MDVIRHFFCQGGNRKRFPAVYLDVARQILLPLALLSVVPVTIMVLFTLAFDSEAPGATKTKGAAVESSASVAEES